MAEQVMESKLWSITDILRGHMDANEYKSYMLSFIFYKYLSENVEKTVQEVGQDEEKLVREKIGYYIPKEYYFKSIIDKVNNDEYILDLLHTSLKAIEESINKDIKDPLNIFEDLDLETTKLGKTKEARNTIIGKVLLKLDEVDFRLEDTETDVLGDAYEYLIGMFAATAGKKGGEFYTPQTVSTILARIVSHGKETIKKAYDPTCGSGSLLLRISKETNVEEYRGQELNTTTYNLARMNLMLHNVPTTKFDIRQGNTLEEPQFLDERFDAIVSNPPYSAHWSSSKEYLKEDPRFNEYDKLAPKSKADYAFIQHMLYLLADDGIMTAVLPHGVLFRGSGEASIRKHIIEKNYLDAVIGLPANLFYGTGIPTMIYVMKKNRSLDEPVLFIDASEEFEKGKKQNILTDEHVDKIVDTYVNREEIERYSYLASMDEIIENDFNLNIPRYVDTFIPEPEIDLDEVHDEICRIDAEMEKIDKELLKYCNELGIKPPFPVKDDSYMTSTGEESKDDDGLDQWIN
ncbi:type I restriction-modification system subunit M [Methanosphaera cuniculi]|uniref:site-specific DNA-methyltransferase (adenine-specific) n=1 Tax=Methanosphaera cuniculi TaxID=1077256 RepID=A0A2V2BK48_9EURY|nr:type I restriction-modification system subunit M [Methanosphaera cuniculi]PWL08126.1 putative type I restriction enzymeP M protein [Methanosphaera cuniculi]